MLARFAKWRLRQHQLGSFRRTVVSRVWQPVELPGGRPRFVFAFSSRRRWVSTNLSGNLAVVQLVLGQVKRLGGGAFLENGSSDYAARREHRNGEPEQASAKLCPRRPSRHLLGIPSSNASSPATPLAWLEGVHGALAAPFREIYVRLCDVIEPIATSEMVGLGQPRATPESPSPRTGLACLGPRVGSPREIGLGGTPSESSAPRTSIAQQVPRPARAGTFEHVSLPGPRSAYLYLMYQVPST